MKLIGMFGNLRIGL